jgi:hypothetical protein
MSRRLVEVDEEQRRRWINECLREELPAGADEKEKLRWRFRALLALVTGINKALVDADDYVSTGFRLRVFMHNLALKLEDVDFLWRQQTESDLASLTGYLLPVASKATAIGQALRRLLNHLLHDQTVGVNPVELLFDSEAMQRHRHLVHGLESIISDVTSVRRFLYVNVDVNPELLDEKTANLRDGAMRDLDHVEEDLAIALVLTQELGKQLADLAETLTSWTQS